MIGDRDLQILNLGLLPRELLALLCEPASLSSEGISHEVIQQLECSGNLNLIGLAVSELERNVLGIKVRLDGLAPLQELRMRIKLLVLRVKHLGVMFVHHVLHPHLHKQNDERVVSQTNKKREC